MLSSKARLSPGPTTYCSAPLSRHPSLNLSLYRKNEGLCCSRTETGVKPREGRIFSRSSEQNISPDSFISKHARTVGSADTLRFLASSRVWYPTAVHQGTRREISTIWTFWNGIGFMTSLVYNPSRPRHAKQLHHHFVCEKSTLVHLGESECMAGQSLWPAHCGGFAAWSESLALRSWKWAWFKI